MAGRTRRFSIEENAGGHDQGDSTETQLKNLQKGLAKKEKLLREKEVRIEYLEQKEEKYLKDLDARLQDEKDLDAAATSFRRHGRETYKNLEGLSKCPITLEEIKEPKVDIYGDVYESEYILRAIRSNPISPLTRRPLTLDGITKDKAFEGMLYLKNIIKNLYKEIDTTQRLNRKIEDSLVIYTERLHVLSLDNIIDNKKKIKALSDDHHSLLERLDVFDEFYEGRLNSIEGMIKGLQQSFGEAYDTRLKAIEKMVEQLSVDSLGKINTDIKDLKTGIKTINDVLMDKELIHEDLVGGRNNKYSRKKKKKKNSKTKKRNKRE